MRRKNLKFNYSKLLGKMKERGFTQEQLAKAIDINKNTLNSKLNNQYSFTAEEMYLICEVLNIPTDKIGVYFYAI